LSILAGIPLESFRGSLTGVFAASMSDDYHRMITKDPESITNSTITGIALSLLANRVSWHFNLLGPSIHIDTACSSSMVALDMACQSLRVGDCSMALVAGVNMILGPEFSVMLANGNYLSPDSLCYSFDSRANGYARGEGVVAMVIKPLSNAVRDGDMIRAVIRSTGSNQDGRTPIMTQPSADSQEQLIRHVYEKAKLGFESTRFVEAHGTGTAVGDPIEMKAIGRVFRSHRSAEEPLYV
jgi:acyl transferase domain-containing protein